MTSKIPTYRGIARINTRQRTALKNQIEEILEEIGNTNRPENMANSTLEPFHGVQSDNPGLWLRRFESHCAFQNIDDGRKKHCFPLFLRGGAAEWFDSLSQADVGDWDSIREAFIQRYESQGRGHIVGSLLARKQVPGESVDDFCTDLRRLAHRLEKDDDDIMDLFINGLQPDIKTQVLLAQPRNLPHALEIARNVQGALPAKPANSTTQEIEASVISALERVLVPVLQSQAKTSAPPEVQVASAYPQVPQPPFAQTWMPPRRPWRQVNPGQFQGLAYRSPRIPKSKNFGTFNAGYAAAGPPGAALIDQKPCPRCCEYGHFKNQCKFSNAQCFACGLIGHIQKACRATVPRARQPPTPNMPNVNPYLAQ